MNTNNLKKVSVSILFLLITASCAKKDDSTSTAAAPAKPSISSLLVTVPSSVAGTSASVAASRMASRKMLTQSEIKKLMSTEESGCENAESGAASIYGGVRCFLNLAVIFSSTIEQLVDAIFSDATATQLGIDLSTIAVGDTFSVALPADPTDESGPTKITITHNATGSTFDYTAKLWFLSSDAVVEGITFSFKLTAKDQGKGEVWFNGGAVSGVGVVHVEFDTADATADGAHSMTISMDDMVNESDPSAPLRGRLKVSEKDSIVTVSSNFYFDNFGGGSNAMVPDPERNYIIIGQVDAITNKGILSVAFPPATSTDTTTTVFTDYAIGSILSEGFGNMIGSYAGQGSDPCCCNIGTYLGSSSANICLAAATATSCTCAASGLTSSDIADLLTSACTTSNAYYSTISSTVCTNNYVFDLDNPAYFDENGFVGTETYNKPTTGYDALSVTGITFESASAIAALNLDYEFETTTP